MKKAMRFFLLLFIVILVGCSTNSNTSNDSTKSNVEKTPTKNKASVAKATSTPAASTSGGGSAKGSSAPTASNIPVFFTSRKMTPFPAELLSNYPGVEKAAAQMTHQAIRNAAGVMQHWSMIPSR